MSGSDPLLTVAQSRSLDAFLDQKTRCFFSGVKPEVCLGLASPNQSDIRERR